MCRSFAKHEITLFTNIDVHIPERLYPIWYIVTCSIVSSNLLSIDKRKRVNRKDCSFHGNYRADVDDGVLEEVRILNEEFQIPTVASCEGHLPYSSAYILGNISEEKQKIFKKYMKKSRIDPVENSKLGTDFLFEEIDYRLNISIDRYYERGFGDGFMLNVASSLKKNAQNEWDSIRKTGFQQALKIIKKAFA